MDIQRERTTLSPRPFTEISPSNGGFPVVRPRDLPYDAYGKLRVRSDPTAKRQQDGGAT